METLQNMKLCKCRAGISIIGMMLTVMTFLMAHKSVGHPLAVTTCEVQVTQDRIETRMNVLVADLVIFQGLKPRENGRYYDYDEMVEAAQKHREFILKYFYIRDGQGRRLDGQSTGMDLSRLDSRKETGIRPLEVMRFGIDYTFEYPLDGKPEFLNFSQIFGGADNPQPETVELLIHRDGILVEAPVKIGPQVPHVVRFDWSKPAEPLPNDWATRKREAEQKMLESLGMPQFSGVYSHLYIEDTEVRHEVILPLVILETLISIDKEDPDYVTVQEQLAARENIERFFREQNPLSVDGARISPQIARVDFFPLDTRDFMKATIPQKVSAYNTRVGIIASYKTGGTPKKLRVQWDGFNRLLPYLKVNVYEFDKEPEYKYLIEEENVFEWTRRGSSINASGNGFTGNLYLPASLMEKSFEADDRVPGRVISPDTDFAVSVWTKLVEESLTATVNGSGAPVEIVEVRFFDLDYQELPMGTFSGAIDLSEVLALTEIKAGPVEGLPMRSFSLDWAPLTDIDPSAITRLMFTEPGSSDETAVTFRDGESSLSWSENFGVGPGSLFSLSSPPEIRMVEVPRYPVLAGVAVLLTIWGLFQWARVKFRPGSRALTATLVAAVAIVATILTGTKEIPSPFSKSVEVDTEEKNRIFEALHQNIYQAFRMPTESRQYDALARGVTGDLLNNLYLEIQKSLVNESTGGAAARVDSVEVTETEPVDFTGLNTWSGFGMDATWMVAGTVEHWGHIHTRTNRYRADFSITAVSNQWKMAGFTLKSQEQVGDPYVGLRSAR